MLPLSIYTMDKPKPERKIHYYMDLDAIKPVFGGLEMLKEQTSLRICAVWSARLLSAF